MKVEKARLRPEPKFAECEECRWLRTYNCNRCGAGEFFEERFRELNPDVDFRFRGSKNDD